MEFTPEQTSILEKALQIIRRYFPDVLAIYVFGSFGTKYEKKQSDLDLAILPSKKLNPVHLWNISQEIAITLNRDVDLVDLTEASTIFRYQIIMNGERIYCSELKECEKIENLYMSMYLRFKEDRNQWTM